MGRSIGYICGRCGSRFSAAQGGGFRFDLLHCDRCGRPRHVLHEELSDIHLRFVKGLPGPYAIARSEFDRRVQAEYPGEPLSREAYEAAAEATLERCACGGTFRYDARARCPTCRSTSDEWTVDASVPGALYD